MSTSRVPHTTPARQSAEKCAAIYARVSTADQADKGYSLNSQRDACLAFAQQHGYHVPPEYIFRDDMSGTVLYRPQLTQLRALVAQHLIQAVIVYDADRLSRSMAHTLFLRDECQQAGVALHVVTAPSGDMSPEGQLQSNILATFAEFERLKILRRTENGRRDRVKAGYVPGGHTYGYRLAPHQGKGAYYAVCDEEAAVVRRIFAWYVTEGLSQEAIAKRLTEDGIPTPGERRPGTVYRLEVRLWHQSAVAQILTNESYVGTMYYGKKTCIAGSTNTHRKTRYQRLDREYWLPVAVPPIIAQEVFDAAQAQIKRHTQRSKRNRKHEYLLIGGRLRCAQCGCAMAGWRMPGRQPRYRCCRANRPYLDRVASHTVRTVLCAPIDEAVWHTVERALRNPALIAQEIERQQANTSAQDATLERERLGYAKQLAKCEREYQRLLDIYLDESITRDVFESRKALIDAKRTSAEQELARLKERRRHLEQAAQHAAALTDYCTRTAAALHTCTLEEKHVALAALNIQVTWHPERGLTITGSIPVNTETASAP
jgi:site-specific DNA recombinase